MGKWERCLRKEPESHRWGTACTWAAAGNVPEDTGQAPNLSSKRCSCEPSLAKLPGIWAGVSFFFSFESFPGRCWVVRVGETCRQDFHSAGGGLSITRSSIPFYRVDWLLGAGGGWGWGWGRYGWWGGDTPSHPLLRPFQPVAENMAQERGPEQCF